MMNFKKNIVVYSVLIGLAVFGAVGWSLALKNADRANANEGNSSNDATADDETLDALYNAVFHRPADVSGKAFYHGRKIKDILRDFMNSDEQRYYGALFKAVKAYEEAQRAPGTLTAEEQRSYLSLIDSALANLNAWIATLPDQEACKAITGPEDARVAIQAVYDRLNAAGKSNAEHGLLNALQKIGRPLGITIHPKCIRASVTPTRTPTPTPTATTTPTPTCVQIQTDPPQTICTTPTPTPNQ